MPNVFNFFQDRMNAIDYMRHQFIPMHYHMPTNCDSCNKPLWHMFKPPPAVECKREYCVQSLISPYETIKLLSRQLRRIWEIDRWEVWRGSDCPFCHTVIISRGTKTKQNRFGSVRSREKCAMFVWNRAGQTDVLSTVKPRLTTTSLLRPLFCAPNELKAQSFP